MSDGKCEEVSACSLQRNSIPYSSYAKLCFVVAEEIDCEARRNSKTASNTHLNEALEGTEREEKRE